MFTRRWLLRAAALASCIPGYGKRDQTLGVQLYTVRDIVLHHPLEMLRSIAEIGYREVEVLRSQITPLAGYLKALGLRPISVHFETPLITGNWQAWKDEDMPVVDERYTFNEALAKRSSTALSTWSSIICRRKSAVGWISIGAWQTN